MIAIFYIFHHRTNMDGKYRNTLTGRLIKTDGVVYKRQSKNAMTLQAVIRRKLYIPVETPGETPTEPTFGFNDLPHDVMNIITYNLYNSMTEVELKKILKKMMKDGNLLLCGYTKWGKQKLITKIINYNMILEEYKKEKIEKAEKQKNKKAKIGITDLVFTYDQFKTFSNDAYGWEHTKTAMPLRKILTDFEGCEYVEGAIIETTASERKRMMNGRKYDYSFRLGFNTDKYGYVEFILNCDCGDKILTQLARASGIDIYGDNYTIEENGRMRRDDEDE